MHGVPRTAITAGGERQTGRGRVRHVCAGECLNVPPARPEGDEPASIFETVEQRSSAGSDASSSDPASAVGDGRPLRRRIADGWAGLHPWGKVGAGVAVALAVDDVPGGFAHVAVTRG